MILGVDPGLSGALAVLGIDGRITALQLLDVPVTERKVGGKTKCRVDPYQVRTWLDLVQWQNPIEFAMIEAVNAMPGQGVTSSFSFGFTYGVLTGVIAAAGIPIRTVAPVVWKRKFGLIGQDKDASRGEASRRFPQWASQWARKKDDGRAEAVLLALYGREMGDVWKPVNCGGTD